MDLHLVWLEEAKTDLAAAENLAQAQFYSVACFHCHQAAEKALKAALIKKNGVYPKSHSLKQLSIDSGFFTQLKDEITLLDGDYTLSRYPDFYGKPPSSFYTHKIFLQKLLAAKNILAEIGKWIQN